MIVTIAVAGILMAIATPSFLSLSKPLRDGSLQFKSQLSLIRSKAISSNKAYRIRPKFSILNLTNYPDGRARNFIVEFAANCKVIALGGTSGWQRASQLDLDLPPNIGITDVASSNVALPAGSVTLDNSLAWDICFDNRGILDSASRKKLILKDFQGFNKAEIAVVDISTVGGIDLFTYPKNDTTTTLVDTSTPPNPIF